MPEPAPGPSATARRVAAARATMERMPADHGDPAADDALAASLVAAEPGGPPMGERMQRYLQGRTRYFDRVVVNGIGRGARQVLIVGAGYDGRALRYAAPGVRFFEVDHPGTQADKRARLDDLHIDSRAITFVPFDLADTGLADALRHHGFDPDAPGPMLCEGLFVYLSPAAIAATLDALRALAAPRTRLALSATRPGRRQTPEHERFRERVAALGEPVGNELEAGEIAERLLAHRWRVVELPERARRVGLMMGAPEWAPAPHGVPPTAGRVGRYLETALHRSGVDTLAGRHGLADAEPRELDVGVFATRTVGGRRVIARLFPAARPQQAVEREARLLTALRRAHSFPAEVPVAVARHDGQPLLVTERVPGRPIAARTAVERRRLGDLLGTLHAFDVAHLDSGEGGPLPAGGAWHHLVPQGGPPSAELDAMAELLDAARACVADDGMPAYAQLSERLADADDCAGLPEAFIHPDLVAANAIGSEPTIIDWAGCGIGPRLWSLAFLLWAAGWQSTSAVTAVAEGYRAHVTLTGDERERLGAAVMARPAVFAAWTFATGRRSLTDAAAGVAGLPAQAEAISRRALAVL